MNNQIERVLRTMRVRRAAAGGECIVCHRQIKDAADVFRLRGGATAHRECATYRVRQHGVPRRHSAGTR